MKEFVSGWWKGKSPETEEEQRLYRLVSNVENPYSYFAWWSIYCEIFIVLINHSCQTFTFFCDFDGNCWTFSRMDLLPFPLTSNCTMSELPTKVFWQYFDNNKWLQSSLFFKSVNASLSLSYSEVTLKFFLFVPTYSFILYLLYSFQCFWKPS